MGPVLSRWKVEGWTGGVRMLPSHPSSIWGYRCWDTCIGLGGKFML